MKQLCLLAALICFGMAAIKFCTAWMKPNLSAPAPKAEGVLSPEEAKARMDANPDLILLDVRTQEEYDEGHISGALLIPYTEISRKAETMLKDKEQLILVYCRSGRRSAIAATALTDMGYNNVKDFGGIIDWPYEIVK